jgi:hypothetical protein
MMIYFSTTDAEACMAGRFSPVPYRGILILPFNFGVNVGSADRYHKQADEARWMVAHALKPENKTVWLRIAQVWTNLAHVANENDKRRERQGAENSN